MSHSLVEGVCDECGCWGKGWFGERHDLYCTRCWEDEELFEKTRRFRCVSFCAVYDWVSGKRLSVAASVNLCCAERQALWRLSDTTSPKALVVARLRRGNRGLTTSNSQPCVYCALQCHFYNVVRVAYSDHSGDCSKFTWQDTSSLRTNYKTACSAFYM